jgi:hypothetical protein
MMSVEVNIFVDFHWIVVADHHDLDPDPDLAVDYFRFERNDNRVVLDWIPSLVDDGWTMIYRAASHWLTTMLMMGFPPWAEWMLPPVVGSSSLWKL